MNDKVLIRRSHPGLGDQICAAGAVAYCSKKLAEVGYSTHACVGRKEWHNLFHDQGYCERYVSTELCRMDVEKVKKEYGYDAIIDLDGVDSFYYNTRGWETDISKNEIFAASAGFATNEPQAMCPRWKANIADIANMSSWFKNERIHMASSSEPGIVGVQLACDPGMAWKNYPGIYRVVELAATEHTVIVFHRTKAPGSPDSANWSPSVSDLPRNNVHVVSDMNLRTLACIVAMCKIVIGPDSGLLHMAAMVDIPHLGIFGGTSGKSTVRPYPKSRYIQAGINAAWRCAGKAPCNGMDVRNFFCYADAAECMKTIDPDHVWEKAKGIMQKEPKQPCPSQPSQ